MRTCEHGPAKVLMWFGPGRNGFRTGERDEGA